MENGRRWKRCSGKVGIRERRDGTRDVTIRRRPEQRSFKELENVEKLLKGRGWDEQRFVVTYDIPQSVSYVLFSSTALRPPNLNVRLLNNLVERRGEHAWKIGLMFSSRFIVKPQPCYKFWAKKSKHYEANRYIGNSSLKQHSYWQLRYKTHESRVRRDASTENQIFSIRRSCVSSCTGVSITMHIFGPKTNKKKCETTELEESLRKETSTIHLVIQTTSS